MNDEKNDFLDNLEEDTQKGKLLTFVLGKENYGFDIMHVTEIVGIQPITEMPELPGFIKGIINLRGRIIPVMDARLRFSKPAIEYNDRTCIVVILVGETSIGVIVDAVSEVLTINEEDIVPPPNITTTGRKFIKAIGKSGDTVTMILNCENLLDEEEKMTLVEAHV